MDAELEFDPTSVDEVLDWSRQLKRELNAANERIKELEAKVDELHDLEKWLEGR
jgi:predicted  nucleic acid-binding Zn-ribbon protein